MSFVTTKTRKRARETFKVLIAQLYVFEGI